MSVVNSAAVTEDIPASRLPYLFNEAKKTTLRERVLSVFVYSALLAGPVGVTVMFIWFLLNGTFQTAVTGKMPTELLSFVKFFVAIFAGISALAGVGFIWNEKKTPWGKVFAIMATILLFLGLVPILKWTHHGRGAVQTSDD